MPYLGRATLRDVLDRLFSQAGPPTRAIAILDAIRSANAGMDTSDLRRPERILRSGSYVDGVIYLAARLAGALAHSHRCGIYHRDLKPSNVLLSPDGQPLVLDFNLSVGGRLPACRIGGTLLYMAPEVLASVAAQSADAETRPYDPRSDVFSLGVILYEALTGMLPFGEIARDVSLQESARRLQKQQSQGPNPVQEKNRQVDDRLAGLIHRCLAFEPDRRPQTAGELAEGLRRELRPHRRGHRWVRDHRRWVSVAASLVLALLVAGIGYLAIRPPYPVRQFQRGMACYEHEDYTAAIGHFNEALRSDPKYSDALFARGRTLLRTGDFRMAPVDFYEARRLAPDPRIDACLGYSLARSAQDVAAIYFCDQAVQKGFQSPGVLNNMAVSHRQLGRLDIAEEYLQRAIAADEHLPAAHLNLVLVHLNRAARGLPVPESALVHARKAAQLCPPSAVLYRYVAALFACAAQERPELVQVAIEYLEKAVAQGLDPASLPDNPAFAVLREHAAFRTLLTKSPGRGPSAEPDFLVDPL
jgi:Flp pilus assembly protein TadD